MPDDDAPEGPELVKLNDLDGQRFANALARPEAPTSALRELFLIERLTDVPVGPVPVLIGGGPAEGGALRAALLSTAGREPVLLAIEPPKAPEPEQPIDVVLPVATARHVNRGSDRPGGRPLGRPGDHSLLCQLLDRPAKRRGLPFVCICGGSRR